MSDVLQPVPFDVDRRAGMASAVATFTDASLLAMILIESLPETIFGKIYVSVFPVQYVFFYLALYGLLLEYLVSAKRLSALTVLALNACVLMLMHGTARGHETKWVVVDVSMFCGLIAGLHWATRRNLAVLAHRLRRWSMAVCFMAWTAVVGIALGLIQPAREGARVYVHSMFMSGWFLALTAPFLFGLGVATRDLLERRRFLRSAFLSLATVLVLGLLTATRHVFLAGAAGVLIFVRIGISHQWGRIAALSVVILVAAGSMAYLGSRPKLGQGRGPRGIEVYDVYDVSMLEKRLASTTIVEEPRYLEVKSLFQQLSKWDIVFGTGFGSRYAAYGTGVSDLAFAPHVGVLAFLQKGGVMLFLLCAVLPAAAALWRLFAERTGTIKLTCWGSVLIYLFVSSLSGGWYIFPLFLYGTFLALATSSRPLEVDQCAS